jgi:NADH dehydrogenase
VTSEARPPVPIVGGGFGVLFAARRLRSVPVDATMLDRGVSNLFQPLLTSARPASSPGKAQHHARAPASGGPSVSDASSAGSALSRSDQSARTLGFGGLTATDELSRSRKGHRKYRLITRCEGSPRSESCTPGFR